MPQKGTSRVRAPEPPRSSAGYADVSLDDFGCRHLQQERYLQSERCSGCLIDYQFKGIRDAHGHFARIFPLENPTSIEPEQMIGVRELGTVAHEAADFRIFPPGVDHGHAM